MEQEVLDRPTTAKVAIYTPIEAGIALMLEKHGGVLTNPPVVTGNATALATVKASRQELVRFRTTLERARKEEKAESLAYGKLVDSEAARIQAFATPIELAYDVIVTTEEKRLEDIRLAELEAERQRIVGHQNRIQAIKDVRETANMCRTSDRIKQLIDGMPAHMDANFEEFQPDAEAAFNDVCEVLKGLHGIKLEAEAAAIELKRQQDELAAKRLAQEESDRVAAVARAAAEKADQERRDAQEADLQAKRLAFDQEQAEARRLQQEAADALASQQRAVDEQAAQVAAQLLEASRPAPVSEQVIADGVVDAEVKPGDIAAFTDAAPVVIALLPNPVSLPTLRLGQINELLKFCSVTAENLRGLGFEPAGRDRAAVLYHEATFEAIRCALVSHLETLGATA